MTASRGLGKLRGVKKSREGVSELGDKRNPQTEQALNLYSARAQPKVGPPRGWSRAGRYGQGRLAGKGQASLKCSALGDSV